METFEERERRREQHLAEKRKKLRDRLVNGLLGDEFAAALAALESAEAAEIELARAITDLPLKTKAGVSALEEVYADKIRPVRQEAVDVYNAAVVTLLEDLEASQNKSWCTSCNSVVDEDAVDLVMIMGRQECSDSDCRYNSWSWIEDFATLYVMCSECRAKYPHESEEREIDKETEEPIPGSPKTHANIFSAKVSKSEKVSVLIDGTWSQRSDFSDTRREKDFHWGMPKTLAEYWNLPPTLTLDFYWDGQYAGGEHRSYLRAKAYSGSWSDQEVVIKTADALA